MKILIPLKIVSEANSTIGLRGGGFWAKQKRKDSTKATLCLFLASKIDPSLLPCTVTLTRVAPRELDDDNLAHAFKTHRDFIAGLLVPGLRTGRADSDKRIKWVYKQEKGKPKEYAMIVEVMREMGEYE